MLYIISAIGLIALAIVIGRFNAIFRFNKEVKLLFSLSKTTPGKTFKLEQLAGLPAPVQRYFKLVLQEGQPYISYARMTHDGQFKPGLDKDWISIKGEQYATTEKPGFIWKGSTASFIARDMFIADKGRLIVSLFSLFNIIDAEGEQYSQGELLRWLGESILYPTNLLPSDRLQWDEIDPQTAKLSFRYHQFSLFFIVTFDKSGEIIQMETKRYMDKKNLETWVIKSSDYKKMNSVMVPTSFEVIWKLQNGDFPYAKFNVQKLEYGRPEKFKRA